MNQLSEGSNKQEKIQNTWVKIALSFVLGAVSIFLILALWPSNSQKNSNNEATAQPGSTVKTEEVSEAIAVSEQVIEDPNFPAGQYRVVNEGTPGERVKTYTVSYVNEQPTNKVLSSDVVIRQPSHRVVAKGTKVPPPRECDDVTSFDYNWQNDMLCHRPDGTTFYTDYAGARAYEAGQG